jgi:hypothetical protein
VSGITAQKLMAQAVRRHPLKDGRSWAIRQVTQTSDGDALSQPEYTTVDIPIEPMVQLVDEREAEYIGHNVLAGDLKLHLPGTPAITLETVMVCNGIEVDVRKVDCIYHGGLVELHRVYVHRRSEGVAL